MKEATGTPNDLVVARQRADQPYMAVGWVL